MWFSRADADIILMLLGFQLLCIRTEIRSISFRVHVQGACHSVRIPCLNVSRFKIIISFEKLLLGYIAVSWYPAGCRKSSLQQLLYPALK